MAEQINGGLLRCSLQNNAEEGAVIMDSAMGTFAQCRVLNNRGPGLDISSSSRVSAKECTISQNVGERKEAPSYALQCKTAWLSLQMYALRNMSSFGTSLILECFASSFVIASLAAKRALQICAALAYLEGVGKCLPSRMMLCYGSAMFCWDVLACEATKSKRHFPTQTTACVLHAAFLLYAAWTMSILCRRHLALGFCTVPCF